MSVRTEAKNREHSPQAETEELAGSKLLGIMFQVVIRIFQILWNIKNPDPISDLEARLKARGAALASSPTFSLFSQFAHFLSTSTYSASITPSSFLASPLPPG